MAGDTARRGKINAVSLAVSPVSGEPVAVWANRPRPRTHRGDQDRARRAAACGRRRSSTPRRPSSFARPWPWPWTWPTARRRVEAGRAAMSVAGVVLTCAMAAGPGGPFTLEPVDSAMHATISLALDPASGARGSRTPRRGRVSAPPCATPRRTAGGGWDVMTASGIRAEVHRAIAGAGPGWRPLHRPHRVTRRSRPRRCVRARRRRMSASSSRRARSHIHHRADAEGAGGFSFVAYVGSDQGDTGNGPRRTGCEQSRRARRWHGTPPVRTAYPETIAPTSR
jgi:hypothetical protein